MESVLVSSSSSGRTMLWDPSKPDAQETFRGAHGDTWAADVSSDARLIAGGSGSRAFLFRRERPGEVFFTLECPEHRSTVYGVCFNSSGDLLAVAFETSVQVWSLGDEPEVRATLPMRHVRDCRFSPDDEHLAVATDRFVKLWFVDGFRHGRLLRGHERKVQGVAWAPDCVRLGSASRDHTARVWDSTSGELLGTLVDHEQTVASIAFHPIEEVAATASHDRSVRIWSLASFTCVQVIKDHSSWVWGAEFSPDGKTLATCSEDRRVEIYRCDNEEATQWSKVTTITGHNSYVNCVRWSRGEALPPK